ncbi:MAG: hydrolase 1, exosortase A system-associated [Candidatus Methylumidiphilus sp.]
MSRIAKSNNKGNLSTSTMKYKEQPIVFKCGNYRLIGIATSTNSLSKTGVLIIVGGPQYRSGSHRQFTLLARNLAENGIPSFRFDYRGMGDSEGNIRNFENLNEDVHTAINAFSITEKVDKIIIWGLCDAASAALYYAHTDPRVAGIILLNPWVHTEVSAERARLKYYYISRLFQKSFWSKFFSGRINFIGSSKEIANSVINLLSSKYFLPHYNTYDSLKKNQTFIERMLFGLNEYSGKVLLILSGNDLVSHEFQQLIESNSDWRNACNSPKIEKIILRDANHTFSTRSWRSQVNELTINWLSKNKHFL